MIDNKTFWALKRREQERAAANPRPSRAGSLVRRARPEDRVDVIPHADERDDDEASDAEATTEGPQVSYRELQAQAKELDIPANQSREDLEAAIDEASTE